jgi:hypothetical protein
MKKTILVFVMLLASTMLMSQMQSVQLNVKKLQFDNGRDLPAEQSFFFTADVAREVEMVRMQISNVSFDKNRPIYESKWIRKGQEVSSVALLSNHYKLRANKKYNYRFLFYQKITEGELLQLHQMIETTATSVLNTNITVKEERFNFFASPSDIFKSLNLVLSDGLVNFEKNTIGSKTTFSGVIENMLMNLTKVRVTSDTSGNGHGSAVVAIEKQLNNEITMILNQYAFVLSDEVVIMEYPTEKKANLLSLNVGYGGIYESGKFSELSYFSGPYAGMSFPLGNKAFSNSFWNNASASVGVFLTNFNPTDSRKVSGPIIGLPIYAAFGYRIFDYLKIHAGTTLLEEKNVGVKNTAIYFAPFIGLSFEFQMWIGVDKNTMRK